MNNLKDNKKIKVFLTGGDDFGWALDQDYRQLEALYKNHEDIDIVSTPDEADVIHSVWWEKLHDLPLEILKKKYIICNLSNKPFHYLTQPKFSLLMPYIDKLISQSSEAEKELESIGTKSFKLFYSVDNNIFKPLHDVTKKTLRNKYNIPENTYIIGNFHRDTDGSNLKKPKLQKGADIFFEIVKSVWKHEKNIHILLAGPRRHWIRNKLKESGIPFTFIGKITEKDDWNMNILKPQQINELYQLTDLIIISSRWEGGPRSVLEASATKTKIISTHVGISPDILSNNCLYDNFIHGSDIVINDIKKNILTQYIEENYNRIIKNHTILSQTKIFENLIKEISSEIKKPRVKSDFNDNLLISSKKSCCSSYTLGIWHSFFKPPYGGGNQFMLALSEQLKKIGARIVKNKFKDNVDCYLINSVHFDREKFIKKKLEKNIIALHRIDGPIQKYRGKDEELDKLCFDLNRQLASATVLQSIYVMTENAKLGYRYVNPVIVGNAVNSNIFNTIGKQPFHYKQKIKLVSSSWSSNINKGFDVYEYLDSTLDWNKFEYTFVGNSPIKFKNIKSIPPVESNELARILKNHDIYITASKKDPCSNALIEALSCGLPALCLKSGGHPEIVGYGGLCFEKKEQISDMLNLIANNYESFQSLINVNSIKEISRKYYDLIKMISPLKRNIGYLEYFISVIKKILNKT